MTVPQSIAISDIQDGGAQMRVEMKPNVVRYYPTQLDHYHKWQRRHGHG